MWGVIYVNHQSLPIFDGKVIKLFRVSVDGLDYDDEDDDDLVQSDDEDYD